jgi:uncharacterized protein
MGAVARHRNVFHGLLRPILLHCRDDQGQPMLGLSRSYDIAEFLHNSHVEIPAAAAGYGAMWQSLNLT